MIFNWRNKTRNVIKGGNELLWALLSSFNTQSMTLILTASLSGVGTLSVGL